MPSHQYQGSNPGRKRRRAGFSQASTRRPIVLYDQWGRKWTAMASIKNGMPTGKITPAFQAPWYPDQQYLKVNPENTSEMFVALRPMLARRKARMDAYHALASDFCRDNKIELPIYGDYPDALQRRVGGAPKPLQPVIAAIQGNKWILGLTNTPDVRLERFVKTKRAVERVLDEYDFGDESFAEVKSDTGLDEANRLARELKLEAHAGAAAAAMDREEGGSVKTFADLEAEDAATFDEEFTAGAELGTDAGGEVENLLDGLDDEHDAAAVGGRTVAPHNVDRAERQAPRRPTASAKRKHGKKHKPGSLDARKEAQRGGRKTLADTAAVIGDGGIVPE